MIGIKCSYRYIHCFSLCCLHTMHITVRAELMSSHSVIQFNLLFCAWPGAVYCLLFKTCSESQIIKSSPVFLRALIIAVHRCWAGRWVCLHCILMMCSVQQSPFCRQEPTGWRNSCKSVWLIWNSKMEIHQTFLGELNAGVESCSNPSCFDLCYSCWVPSLSANCTSDCQAKLWQNERK